MERRDFLRAASVGVLAALTETTNTGAAIAAEASDTPPAPIPAGAEPTAGLPCAQARANAAPVTASARQSLSLNKAWRFYLGDIAFPVIRGHGWTYSNAKAGSAWGAAASNFDDSDWRTLDLPHDWVVEGPFEETANVSQGYRPRGVAWYRRPLRLDEADRGKHLELQFGAIGGHCTIWFNNTVVARNYSGYNSVYVDITALARYGNQPNNIVIRIDANPMEGWWYEGAGLYRHALLVKRSALHIITDGVYAHPRRNDNGGWRIPIEVTVRNTTSDLQAAEVECELIDPDGAVVGRASGMASGAALNEGIAAARIDVTAPKLWSIETPHLYQVRTRLKQRGALLDEAVTPAGFRTVRFDAREGFFLNDQHVKIQGVCLHQDHAGVGVAVPDSIWEYRFRRLKELGCNAVRCAHNAPAKEFLEAADRIGMLIMDENRNFNISPDYMEQLRWLVRRDRNHPSVILWSVFNEEPMQGTEQGYEMVRRMASEVKLLDDERPVTAAMNDGMFTPLNVSHAVDVVGFNYQPDKYDRYHEAFPDTPLTSSEDTSSFETRGEYTTDRERHIMAGFDSEAAPWGASHRNAWRAVAERRFIAGGFVWTGFDYRGEPTPFEWPSAGSFFGIMDLCGFPKTSYYLHQAHWIKDRPILAIAPHWNWPGREGQPIKVMAFTNADEVALLLNGQEVARGPIDPIDMAAWEIPYAPGRLEAVSYKDGAEHARVAVETTGAAVALRLSPDRPTLAGDGFDAQPIAVFAVDAQGRPVPTINQMIEFEIEGGRIIGLGNGDPNSHEPEKGLRRSLFNGLAQVIVQANEGARGALRLRARGEGLRMSEARIAVNAAALRPAVPATPSVQILDDWRQSPTTAERPDPNVALAGQDMNSWGWMRPGEPQTAPSRPAWTTFRGRFTPRASIQRQGGVLIFGQVIGRAEVWLDGRLLGRKTSAAPAEFSARIPAAEGERIVNVLIEANADGRFGLSDVVTVRE